MYDEQSRYKVSATGGYSTEEASSSGVEASFGTRGVMREVRPNKESRKGIKEAAGLGEAKISASMILRLTERLECRQRKGDVVQKRRTI